MSDTKPPIDLSALSDEYTIVGERDSPDDSRIFVADRKSDDSRRRDDRTGVLITVYSTPPGDEANALTQYAADIGTLTGLTHRRLVPVLDSKWIGDDAFAVVTQRVNDPTLAQRLVMGETFHSTRIAAILREVNGLLEWAREQKIVHRRVTPDHIFLEPNTDRVRISFGIAPIKRLKQPGPHDDARTIARLAVAMLGGDPEIQACDQSSLMALRPGLPQLFCEATSNLLDPKDTATPEDVAAYLGLIGMADPLVEGETERDRIRAEILEEQRVEREKLAAERAEFEQKIADERAAFEKQMADERATFEKEKADERAAAERAKEEERARVENERRELQKVVTKERAELQAALSTERAALLARREELEKTVADQVAELQRTAANDRAEIERLRAAIRTAGDLEVEKKRLAALDEITGDEESVLDNEDLATPLFGMPVLLPIEPVSFDEETPVMSREPIVFEAPPMPEEPVDGNAGDGGPGFWASGRNRVLAGAAAAIIVIGAASAIVIGNRQEPAPATRPVARAGTQNISAGTVTSPAATAAAPVAVATPAVATPAFTVDSASARQWLDSLKHAHPVDVSWAIDMAQARIDRAARAKAAAARASSATTAAPASDAAGAAGIGFTPTRDTNAPTPRAPRDTAARRDSVARPDSSAVPPSI